MKATGIVRRIDELGRIVIPKEIRRTLRIRETDPMEIFTDKRARLFSKNILRSVNLRNVQRNIRSRWQERPATLCVYLTESR